MARRASSARSIPATWTSAANQTGPGLQTEPPATADRERFAAWWSDSG
ncbi:MAG: hypothetical protein ACRDTE_07070 [Pseudonocardiaceae bacterium]